MFCTRSCVYLTEFVNSLIWHVLTISRKERIKIKKHQLISGNSGWQGMVTERRPTLIVILPVLNALNLNGEQAGTPGDYGELPTSVAEW